MDRLKLRVLLEVDQGDYHANQCVRFERDLGAHAEFVSAFDWLVAWGLIEPIGNDYLLTYAGVAALDAAVEGARADISE